MTNELLSRTLPQYLPQHRWFAGKARTIQQTAIIDRIPLPETGGPEIDLVFCRVDFTAGPAETYLLPIAFATGTAAESVRREQPEFMIATTTDGVLYDATPCDALWHTLLRIIGDGRTNSGDHGGIAPAFTPTFEQLGGLAGTSELHRHTQQQSHSSAHFGDRLMLKLFRKLATGFNPDLEIGEFLTRTTPRASTPAVAGWLEYFSGAEWITLALLQEFVPNQGDAWTFTLNQLGRFYAAVHGQPPFPSVSATTTDLLRLGDTDIDPAMAPLMNLETAALLGRRTGELHVALASDASNPDFAPEPFEDAAVRQLHESMRATVTRAFALLRQRQSTLPADVQAAANRVAGIESSLLTRLDALPQRRWASQRIRVHGDYHLGQVLWTGSDFVIIDFEGEPDRPIAERRIKQSPLKDVAGMLRSFHYASHAGLMGLIPGVTDQATIKPWLQSWYVHTAAAFLRDYRQAVASAALVPDDTQEFADLLDLFVLEKLVYELAYELNSRPDWTRIPLAGLTELDQSQPGAPATASKAPPKF